MPRCVPLVLLIAAALLVCRASAEQAPDFAKGGVPFLKKHCVSCHGADAPQAELSLAKFGDSQSLVRSRKVWENVLKMLRLGQMPPEGEPQPSADEVAAFVAHVEAVFDYADRHAKPDPGRVTMRRLNRREYKNTVRDLLGADFDPTEGFPADDVGHGFDNIGDVLSLSPLLMERYLDAAETISKRVILVNPPKPSRRYLAGRYLRPSHKEVAQGRYRPLDPTSSEPYLSGPFLAPGSYLKFSAHADLIFRATLYAEPKGKAPVRVALFIFGANLEGLASDDEVAQFIGAEASKLKSVKILKTFEITATDPKKPQEIEVLISRMGGINSAGIALLKPPPGEEPAKLFVQHLWSEGPMETRPASQLKILSHKQGASPAERNREVLTRLLRGAYRRPPTSDEVARLTKLVEAVEASGQKWEAAIQQAIQVTLCSPKFLFRVELDDRPQSPAERPLDEFQLASRLSYFLWSSMPDEELLRLAEKKQLTANLDAQVRRMLADPKSSELVTNFALQWLQVERLKQFAPDAELFPTFNERLRAAMLKETELFCDSVMREDRSILDLLAADYTFLNQPLAQHYGIVDTNGTLAGQKPTQAGGAPIRGNDFVRVALPANLRGGLLTQASVLTVTSNPTRTSPVKRGRWVLEQILGEPPPPPPPNVPELPADEQAVATGSLRQRMEVHRKNPSCANCHAKMDPIGFALENFDAVGRFRTKDGEFEIDPAGEFADGSKFAGPADLKTVLVEKKELFARCLTEKMLTFALGRGIEYYDRPTVERIVANLKAKDYKFSVLVTEIVKSDPFRKRRGSQQP